MDSCIISAVSAEKSCQVGASLSQSLYTAPLTILLRGELGAGKTTFMQGLGAALGITETITSPTYALEQRYRTVHWGELAHIDLYRLTSEQAKTALLSSEHHQGLRVIEWFDRVAPTIAEPHIAVDIEEVDASTRRISIQFEDIPLPSRDQILGWRKEAHLPQHIAAHCDAVAGLCETLASELQKRGRVIRPLALLRAAEVHDLFRFLDFRPGAHPPGYELSADEEELWETWRARFPNMKHEKACAEFLRERGFSALASIVEVHGLSNVVLPRDTVEKDVLFYADKRVRESTIVTLEERFEDFKQRYRNGKDTLEASAWFDETRKVENELFGSDIP